MLFITKGNLSQPKKGVYNEKNIIFICDFYKYAVTGCTIEWIRSGMPEAREVFVKKIADIFEATVSDAVKAFEIKKN